MDLFFSLFCLFKEAVTQASELKESCNTLEVIRMGRSQGGGSGFRAGGVGVQGSVALMVVLSREVMPRYQLQ